MRTKTDVLLKLPCILFLMPHGARGCPFITNVDGDDFVGDGITKYDGYGDECRVIYFAGVAVFQRNIYAAVELPWCPFRVAGC